MNKQTHIYIATALTIIASNSQAVVKKLAKDTTPKLNVVLIVLDDVGWMDFGCYGSKLNETPNIDSIAQQGIRFTNSYACPQSSPSRFGLLTGINPAKKGLTRAIIPSDHKRNGPNENAWVENSQRMLAEPDILSEISQETKTLPEYLRSVGYSTAMFGKWHLGNMQTNSPLKHGFDMYMGGSEGGPKSYFSPYGLEYLTDGPIGEHLDDRLTTESIHYIDNKSKTNKKQPFFLYMSYYSTHEPWQAKPELLEKFKTKVDVREHQRNPYYASMMYTLDENIGRLKRHLQKNNLLKNTLIIITSDNGGVLTFNHSDRDNPGYNRGYFVPGMTITSNEPLRGGKSTVYEGGIRVPTIIYYPNCKPSVNQNQVAIWDWMPTVLDILQIPLENNNEVDGESIWSSVQRNKIMDKKPLFIHFPHYQAGYSHDQEVTNYINYPCTVLRKGDWKLIYSFEKNPELYNISSDFREEHNVASENPQIVQELSTEILLWLKKNGAYLPMRNANYKLSHTK
jgi:arylsulfatase A-like enzyme